MGKVDTPIEAVEVGADPAFVASPSSPSVSTKGFNPGERAFDPSRGLHILQHSLGVDRYGEGDQYRNHFATGEGSTDYPDCMAMVEAGLMEIMPAPPFTRDMDVFYVTEAGKVYVAANSPPPPKLTAGQRRYREWLNVSDATGESFIDFCRRAAIAKAKGHTS